ncbi:MAG TPA: transglutaminase-like cysteine peptidase [Burkholderiales bacterium]|nr:transglutaminase-like cysteine peptidase [Burkholderiales bacterium]
MIRAAFTLSAFAVTFFAGAAIVLAQPRAAERGYTTMVSERLVAAYERRFGPGTAARLETWKRYAAERKGAPLSEAQLLEEVNRMLNRVRFLDDPVHWREVDYWATPAESVGSNGADCEDFSIAKYFLLKELGVPNARLRMTYVKAVRLNQAHMVVAYYPRPDAEPLVLDNLEDAVRPASQRTDLIPVYSFNDEEVWIETRGRSGSPRQIRNWTLLLERLEREART